MMFTVNIILSIIFNNEQKLKNDPLANDTIRIVGFKKNEQEERNLTLLFCCCFYTFSVPVFI